MWTVHQPVGGGRGRRAAVCLAGLFCLLLLAGCAKNTVRLVYQSPAQENIPQAGAPSVCVAMFKDKRPTPPVGRRSDGSDFMPGSEVNDWVTRSLATELSRRGLVVTVASSEAEAQRSGAQFILSGSVDQVWLAEKSTTEYEAKMSSTVALTDRQGRTLLNKSFASSVARRAVPVPSLPQEMLSEGVQELVLPMSQAVLAKAHP